MTLNDGSMNVPASPSRRPSYPYAILVVIVVVAMLSIGVTVLDLPTEVTMLCAFLTTIALALPVGYKYSEIQDFAFDAVRAALQPIFILIAVGAMTATWIASGTVPTLVTLGFEILSPNYFLVGSLLFCAVLSILTGTSWGTMGTLGVALIIIAGSMDIPLSAAAGAIVCGAIFGDKMSPLSDSTNLSTALADTNLMAHIRHMLWTNVPALMITAGIFLGIDLSHKGEQNALHTADALIANLEKYFSVGWVNLTPAVVVVVLLAMRKPAFVSIAIGALIAVPFAVVVQHQPLSEAMSVMFNGYSLDSGNKTLDDMLSSGGMEDMLGTVVIMLVAVAMGGVLGGAGILKTILDRFVRMISTSRRLILSTIAVTLLSNAMTGSNSPAHVVSASLMRPLFDRFNLHRKNLSRILEDAATITGPIIPWNTAAVFAAGVLGVSTLSYLPFTFLSILVPIISALYGLTGFTIVRADDTRGQEEVREQDWTPDTP